MKNEFFGAKLSALEQLKQWQDLMQAGTILLLTYARLSINGPQNDENLWLIGMMQNIKTRLNQTTVLLEKSKPNRDLTSLVLKILSLIPDNCIPVSVPLFGKIGACDLNPISNDLITLSLAAKAYLNKIKSEPPTPTEEKSFTQKSQDIVEIVEFLLKYDINNVTQVPGYNPTLPPQPDIRARIENHRAAHGQN